MRHKWRLTSNKLLTDMGGGNILKRLGHKYLTPRAPLVLVEGRRGRRQMFTWRPAPPDEKKAFGFTVRG